MDNDEDEDEDEDDVTFDVDIEDEGEVTCDRSLLAEFNKPETVSTALAELVDITVTLGVGWLINRPSLGTSIGTV